MPQHHGTTRKPGLSAATRPPGRATGPTGDDQHLPAHLREALRYVLADLAYPAQRWQILAHAVHWGASPAFCAVLAHLPERTYHSHGSIHFGLADTGPGATQARRASTATATRRPPAPAVATPAGPATSGGPDGVARARLATPHGAPAPARLTQSIWATSVRSRSGPLQPRHPATDMPQPSSKKETR